jgi:hypothetical protein
MDQDFQRDVPDLTNDSMFGRPSTSSGFTPDMPSFMGKSTFNKPSFDPSVVAQGSLPQTPEVASARSSIMDEYNRLLADRPERARLREMMESAPQRKDYKVDKLSRIGAILGGAAAGFRDPSKGVELAQSIIDRPYNEAMQTYQDKLRNVGALAGMEGEDVRSRIEGLQIGRKEQTDERDFGQKQAEFNANQKYREDSLKAQGWDFYTDERTGKRIGENSVTGERKELGLIAETREEKTKREADVAKALAGSHERIAQIGATSRENVADKKAASASANLRARAQLLKPGDVNIKASNDLAALADIYELSVADMEKYVDVDEATNRIFVNDDRTGKAFRNDSERDLEIKAAMRQVLARTYGGGGGGGAAKDDMSKPSASHAPAGGKVIGGWVINK